MKATQFCVKITDDLQRSRSYSIQFLEREMSVVHRRSPGAKAVKNGADWDLPREVGLNVWIRYWRAKNAGAKDAFMD